MALSPNLLLPAAKVVTLLIGGLLTYLAYRAYRRTGKQALRRMAAGFALLVLGGVVSGALHQVADLPLEGADTLESLFTAVGFAVLAASLYTRERTTPSGRKGRPGSR